MRIDAGKIGSNKHEERESKREEVLEHLNQILHSEDEDEEDEENEY